MKISPFSKWRFTSFTPSFLTSHSKISALSIFCLCWNGLFVTSKRGNCTQNSYRIWSGTLTLNNHWHLQEGEIVTTNPTVSQLYLKWPLMTCWMSWKSRQLSIILKWHLIELGIEWPRWLHKNRMKCPQLLYSLISKWQQSFSCCKAALKVLYWYVIDCLLLT